MLVGAAWLGGQADGSEDGQAIVPEGGIELEQWIQAGAILLIAILAGMAIRRMVTAWVERRETEHRIALIVGRFSSAIVVIAGIVYALNALGVRIAPLLGALGVGGIALAFAFQHILENAVAALLLQARRPFVVGDQITAGEHRGTVEEVNLRSVVLRTLGNNRVFLPSANVLRDAFVNHTAYDSRRTDLAVGVAYGTDLDVARRVLTDAAQRADGVLPYPQVEALVHEFGESSINLLVRFWHPPRIADEWRVRDAVARSVKTSLDEAGITIPFPQRTLWFPGTNPT